MRKLRGEFRVVNKYNMVWFVLILTYYITKGLSMRTLKVRGFAEKSYKPNKTNLHIKIQVNNEDYNDVINHEQETFQYLKNEFGSRLKTLNYQLSPYYEQSQHEGVHQSIFKGFQLNHELVLSFKLDMKKLAEAIATVAKAPHHPSFVVEYAIDHFNQDELTQLAIQDAFHQADIITKESKVTLKGILSINNVQDAFQPRMKNFAHQQMTFESISQSTTIEIEWEIEI